VSVGGVTPGPLLTDRVVVVTGGAGGIGRGIVDLCAAHGAAVVVVDRDADRTAATVAETSADGGRAVGVTIDVTAPGAAAQVVRTADDAFGGVDVLVNNVGHFLYPGRPFVESAPDEWEALHHVNLGHVLALTHAVLPGMIERGRGGSIVNLTTVEAFRGIPQHPVYAAYKAAVTQFGRSLAVEVGRHGIRVNDVAPDVTRSRQLPYERWLSEDDLARVPTWVPLGRLGEPRDTAGAVLFLASDLGAFVTGTTVHCDGGTYAAGGWYPTDHDGRGWTNRPRDP
jgi:NAD(P)-dependent dehydrogenase (short-subunit alcohol dehydrogenase family)